MLLLISSGIVAFGCGSDAIPEEAATAPPAAVADFVAREPTADTTGVARLLVKPLGRVSLPDGRLATSDAFINDAPLLLPDLPARAHAVELLLASHQDDARVAAARVRIADDPVAAWHHVGNIPIDSGSGAFFDPQISTSDRLALSDELLARFDSSYQATYATAVLTLQGRTFVAFSTGFGDGTYPVYLGTSASGQPVVVLVDFEILPWTE